MTLAIDWIDEIYSLSTQELQLVQELGEQTLEQLKLQNNPFEISITIVDDPTIQQINQAQRQVDAPTDVLSFPLYEDLDLEQLSQSPTQLYLGDLVISLDRVQAQAQEYGHSYQRELGFLAVHGLLHLLGFDHQTPQQEKEMFQLQKQVMDTYGLTRDS